VNGDSDDTPNVLPVANVAHAPLVRALHNHAILLGQTREQLRRIGDDIRSRVDIVPASQLAELGKVFRDEADSALDLARAAEKLAAAGAGR
jgi:hypothetical protein